MGDTTGKEHLAFFLQFFFYGSGFIVLDGISKNGLCAATVIVVISWLEGSLNGSFNVLFTCSKCRILRAGHGHGLGVGICTPQDMISEFK
jgi:hypothetical protein